MPHAVDPLPPPHGLWPVQMFFDDDLPVWGFIGKTENKPGTDGKPQSRQFLFTHFHFDIGYNGDQVRPQIHPAAAQAGLSLAVNASSQ